MPPLEPQVPVARCKAHSKRSGEQCGRAPYPGATVCYYHGGGAPQVQAKAEERILAMVDPALHHLSMLIEEADTDAVKLNAIKDVLDRAGYSTKHKLTLEIHQKRIIGVPEEEI